MWDLFSLQVPRPNSTSLTNLIVFVVLNPEVVPKLCIEVIPPAEAQAVLKPEDSVPASTG